MRVFVQLIAVLVLLGSIYVGYITLHDFVHEFLVEELQQKQPTPTPPNIKWTGDEKLVLESITETAKSIPPEFLKRIHEIRFVKLSLLSVDQLYQHLGQLPKWQPNFPVLNPKGDLSLIIQLHKSEDSIYLFYAVEELRNNNRIFEISDQKKFK